MALLGAVVAAISTQPGVASAQGCSCPDGQPVAAAFVAAAAFADSDGVFEGRVQEVTPDGATVRVTLEVVQHWKGVESERAVVETSAAGCGVPFTEETSWLVYARRRAEGWTTDLCTGTRRIEDAGEALAALGAGVVPVDLTDEDDVEEPSAQERSARPRPRRGGCASCAVGARQDARPPMLASLVVSLGALAVRRRPARPSRRRGLQLA